MLYKTIRKLAIILVSVTFIGCAVTPKTRFPGVYQHVEEIKSVDLVVDVLVRSDIPGKDIGIDTKKQQTMIDSVVTSLTGEFEARGIELNLVHSGFGLLYTPDESRKHVYSSENIGTEELFEAAVYTPAGSPWGSDESVNFLKSALIYAPVAKDTDYDKPVTLKKIEKKEIVEDQKNVKKKRTSSKKKKRKRKAKPTVQPLKAELFPAFLEEESQRYVLFAHADLIEVSAGKTVASMMATGLLTAVLTGGMYVQMSGPASGSMVDLTLFDTQTQRVVWHNRLQGGNLKGASNTVKMAISSFPGKPEDEEAEDDIFY